MPGKYTFSRAFRLQHALEFAAVYDAKVRDSRGPLAIYALPNDKGVPRLGLSVPGRVGNAVRRNRVKRLLREAFRLMQHDWPAPYDIVINVRPHGPTMLADYQRLLSAAMLRLHKAWQAKLSRDIKPD